MMAGEKAKNPTHASAIDITAELGSMSKEALKRECKNWRTIWDLLDDETKSFLMRAGEEVFIFKRDGKAFEGTYVRPLVNVAGHEFQSMERIHSTLHKRMYLYKFLTRVYNSNIVDFKFIESAYDDPRDNQFADKINAETASQAESMQANDD